MKPNAYKYVLFVSKNNLEHETRSLRSSGWWRGTSRRSARESGSDLEYFRWEISLTASEEIDLVIRTGLNGPGDTSRRFISELDCVGARKGRSSTRLRSADVLPGIGGREVADSGREDTDPLGVCSGASFNVDIDSLSETKAKTFHLDFGSAQLTAAEVVGVDFRGLWNEGSGDHVAMGSGDTLAHLGESRAHEEGEKARDDRLHFFCTRETHSEREA